MELRNLAWLSTDFACINPFGESNPASSHLQATRENAVRVVVAAMKDEGRPCDRSLVVAVFQSFASLKRFSDELKGVGEERMAVIRLVESLYVPNGLPSRTFVINDETERRFAAYFAD